MALSFPGHMYALAALNHSTKYFFPQSEGPLIPYSLLTPFPSHHQKNSQYAPPRTEITAAHHHTENICFAGCVIFPCSFISVIL
jgi:hypothetical protein